MDILKLIFVLCCLFVENGCLPINVHVCQLTVEERRLTCVLNSSGVYSADRSLEGITSLNLKPKSATIQATLSLKPGAWADLREVKILDHCRNMKVDNDEIGGVALSCMEVSKRRI